MLPIINLITSHRKSLIYETYILTSYIPVQRALIKKCRSMGRARK